MRKKNRRVAEMGTKSLGFSAQNPDTSPGYVAALERLASLLKRADELASQQREGFLQVRTATARKRDLRRSMRRAHLAHLASVAQAAAGDLPELPQKFIFGRKSSSYLAFRTAARGMQAEALGHKEVLVKHGLTDTVMDGLATALNEFDAAVEQGVEGRRAHVSASAELDLVAEEIVQIVQVMDGLNQFRFENDPARLAAWESASNVFGGSRTPVGEDEDAPPSGEKIEPAA